ncbi:MAG: CCA tRNA nucleotidyltransferase [Actinobacteria bacterium]|nr:CCA tRNA nucleotidyltransferase [Actinomycetota bacterium]
MSTPHELRVIAQLAPISGLLTELGGRFKGAGYQIALVGGPVRDALLGRVGSTPDLDFTTDARPEAIIEVIEGLATAIWDVGIAFGTVGARIQGQECEITTYRTEHYDRESRKPAVDFGDTLEGDLGRRDFTVNAFALRLPQMQLVDLFDGATDLENYLLRTPGRAQDSFDDDPLRIMRAARFVSQLGFRVSDDILQAMHEQAERITIVSAERVREEFMKILMAPDPRAGLELLVDTGVTKPKTRKFEKEGGVSFHHHEMVGARMVKKRMQAMRFPNDTTDQVSRLVELHLRFHGYGTGEWTDSAVRRYVRDAGAQLVQLHKLTRADSTTRNKRRAAALQQAYSGLENRINVLEQEEELASLRPDLDGAAIMRILNLPPGPVVGEAYRFLMDLRLDRGPLGEEQATEALLAWWAARR